MKKFALALVGLLVMASTAGAQTCPKPLESPATTKPAISEEQQARSIRNLAKVERQLKSGAFPAVGLGDSIMRRWPRDLLDSAMGLTTLNAGFGGDRTEDLLWRLENMDWSRQRTARLVLVLIGTNNTRDSNGCDIYWGIRAVIDKTRHVFPSAKVVVFSVLPRGKDMLGSDADIRTVNTALDETVKSTEVSLLNAHDVFLCDHKTPCGLVDSPANVHPTRRGYELLGRLLSQRVAGFAH